MKKDQKGDVQAVHMEFCESRAGKLRQMSQRIPLSDRSIDALSREIIEITDIIGDFKRDIDIHMFGLLHHCLPDAPHDVETHIQYCRNKIADWKGIIAQRVLILLGYPRGRMQFTTQKMANDVALSALAIRINLLVKSRPGI